MSTLSPAELHERFKELIAARTPVAIATIVRGGRIGTKMLILNDQTIGTLGDA